MNLRTLSCVYLHSGNIVVLTGMLVKRATIVRTQKLEVAGRRYAERCSSSKPSAHYRESVCLAFALDPRMIDADPAEKADGRYRLANKKERQEILVYAATA